jgi:hypothetical protein
LNVGVVDVADQPLGVLKFPRVPHSVLFVQELNR